MGYSSKTVGSPLSPTQTNANSTADSSVSISSLLWGADHRGAKVS